MRIVQVSTTDLGGGAEKIAWKLHRAFRDRGHDSKLVVGIKRSRDPDVLQIDNSRRRRGIGLIKSVAEVHLGFQSVHYPGSHKISELVGHSWDVTHLHNLHGGYFDLSALRRLASIAPTIVTMQDMWLLTGHCAHSFGCERWQLGCGACPDLTIYPSIRRDATRFNLRRKKRIFRGLPIVVSSPARWILEMSRKSYLADYPGRRIPNFVDTRVFRPGDPRKARSELNLPLDRPIILFPANLGLRNEFKDPEMFLESLKLLLDLRPLGITFGFEDPPPNQSELRIVPRTDDEREIAKYFQAADIVAHPARADTFPLALLEALASGRPVVATRVGGIPEIIEEGRTGLLVSPSDVNAFAGALRSLILDRSLAKDMGQRGSEVAAQEFDLQLIVSQWLDWYSELRAVFAAAGRFIGASPGRSTAH